MNKIVSCQEAVQLADWHIKGIASHFEKPPCACGTFIVHEEIGYLAFLNFYYLAVLAANIDYAVDFRPYESTAYGMGRNFSKRSVGKADAFPAVARRDKITVSLVNAKFLKYAGSQIVGGLFRLPA